MKKLLEELSVSNEVVNETQKLVDEINNIIKGEQVQNDIKGTYIEKQFQYTIFNEQWDIILKCYLALNKEYYKRDLLGVAIIPDKKLYLDLLLNDDTYFENMISHELLHIFQYTKNKVDYLSIQKNKELYNIINEIKNNPIKYTGYDNLFADALYISFTFEQDAMAHGLYHTLKKYLSVQIQNNLKYTEEYAYLKDLKNAICDIDEYNSELFGLTKARCLYRLRSAYKRYKEKVNHIINHIIKDKELYEGHIHYFRH